MQSDSAMTMTGHTGAPAEVDNEATVTEAVADSQQPRHSLLDALLPANPPEPKNPRIIRRFDLEAAKNDPKPGEPAAAEKPAVQPSRSREEARALRNRSLAAAAGLV